MADYEEEKPTSPRAHPTAPPSPPPYRPTETLIDQPFTNINKMPAIPTVPAVIDVLENQRSVASEGHPQTKDLPPLKTSSYKYQKMELTSQKSKQDSNIFKNENNELYESSEQKTNSLTPSVHVVPPLPLEYEECNQDSNLIKIESVKEKIDPIVVKETKKKDSLIVPSIQVLPFASFDSQESKEDSNLIRIAPVTGKENIIDPITIKKTLEQNKNSMIVPSQIVLPSAPFDSQDSENEIKPMDSEALERSESSSGAYSMEQNVITRSRTDEEMESMEVHLMDLAAQDWFDDDDLRRRFYSGI